MKCVMCGAATAPPTFERVPYLALPGVQLDHATVHRCPQCDEEYVNIGALGDVEARVAQALAWHPGRLTGRQVRFLRRCLDWSGKDFAQHFEVDPATVSRWENDAQEMTPQAEKLLRLAVVCRRQGAWAGRGLEALLAQAGQAPADFSLVVDVRALAAPANPTRSAAGNQHLALAA